MKLKDRVAIVTGSASGIGRGIAQRLVKEDASVVIADIDPLASARAAQEIGSAAMARPTDVSSSHEVQALIQDVVRLFGGVDILVNNAARTHQARVLDTREEDWDAVINVNLRGPFLCAKYAGPYLMKSPCGRIINIVSFQVGVPFAAAYCASKMGLMALTQTLMHEMAPFQVTVNAVCPGGIAYTPLAQRAIELKAECAGLSPQQILEQLERIIPLKRFGSPEDVASVVAFLVSDEAAYVTGALYSVTGGLLGHALGG